MKILPFAARNVRRHWHRSLVTILAMGFAGAIMVLYSALMEGMLADSKRNAIVMNTGEIQIHAGGYRSDPDLYNRLADPAGLIDALEAESLHASQRLFGFGLAAAGSASAGVQLRGVDMLREHNVTQLHQHVMQGQWLDSSAPSEVVIGKKLARTLGVGLGDEVIVVSQGADGSMANELYTVRGILKAVGEGIDRGGFFMTEASFRQLMVLPEGAHEIVIMSDPTDPRTLEARSERVQQLASGQEVKNWKELSPIIANILEAADGQIIVLILITYIAVAMVILNAMLMSVFERIREFGVMKAVGVSPWQIVMLVMAETQIQVVIAALLTVLLGLPFALHFETHGIDLTAMAGDFTFAGIALDPYWHALVTPESVYLPVVLLFIVATLSVIYPALKAALIQPVKAIHYQ